MRLNVIKVCHLCGGAVIFTNNSQLYGNPIGEWPYVYLCLNSACQASVGCHPGTDRPLGQMADRATRQARRNAHAHFDALWQNGQMSRSAAYEWLATQMRIPRALCHIGKFDAEQCQQVVELVNQLVSHRG